MAYTVKEIFYTLQGEGTHIGRPAVFVRFAGCNLWSGREADRELAICRFCDTDFVGTDGAHGGRYGSAQALADRISQIWPSQREPGFVVLTGGEPLLQVDHALTEALHDRHFYIAVETNGTRLIPEGIDWVCVSPKGVAPLVVAQADELKLVYPQVDAPPERFAEFKARRFYLSPMAEPKALAGINPAADANTQAAVRYCLAYPKWRLTLQSHKLLDIA